MIFECKKNNWLVTGFCVIFFCLPCICPFVAGYSQIYRIHTQITVAASTTILDLYSIITYNCVWSRNHRPILTHTTYICDSFMCVCLFGNKSLSHINSLILFFLIFFFGIRNRQNRFDSLFRRKKLQSFFTFLSLDFQHIYLKRK